MEKFIAPDILGIIIQTIGAIVVALITYRSKPGNDPNRRAAPHPPNKIIYALVGGIAASITFAVIGFLFNTFTPKPTVEITSPSANQQIEVRLANTGSGSFIVNGISSKIFSDPDLRVYVLIHPFDPPAAGWWIQEPAAVEQNGQWSTIAWIGSKDFPPHVGDEIDILVVAARPELVRGLVKISDPKDVNPAAQSDIFRVSIAP